MKDYEDSCSIYSAKVQGCCFPSLGALTALADAGNHLEAIPEAGVQAVGAIVGRQGFLGEGAEVHLHFGTLLIPLLPCSCTGPCSDWRYFRTASHAYHDRAEGCMEAANLEQGSW